MGAFNTVCSHQVCQTCHTRVELVIQFKYGDVWQHSYQVGDPLLWDRNNEGEPGHTLVVLDAIAEACPHCGTEGQEYEVYVAGDTITAVRPASGAYDFATHHVSYLVLED
ncbi:MAG TPA: hypothetical protein VGD69_11110 [Herpetosiphonaceae bacterium]